MDVFPPDYVQHNLPLLLLSGLATEESIGAGASSTAHDALHDGGFRIKVDAPIISGQLADQVLAAFRQQDASNRSWKHAAAKNSRVFKIATAGRVYTLPPRKAPPPPHSPRFSAADAKSSTPSPLVLHSPISPLTPSSTLYPDGILTPLWITKHQSRLPCVFVLFIPLVSDRNSTPLQDHKLKSEISNVRSVLASASCKTRLVIVLVADGEIETLQLDERLGNVRRSTGLDARSVHSIAHDLSASQIEEFVNNLLASIYPSCLEYYRDLSKHARRKRNRSTTPPPTIQPGTTNILSSQGWNVRYEFKLGVLAEFRQEMDAACRNFESAYESLFTPELIDSVAVWSPRFNEARMLADVIAIRTIRCLLLTDQPTMAIRSWLAHRDRIRDLVIRRAKGTDSYDWEAWQSVWAKVMADLVSQFNSLEIDHAAALLPIFIDADKSLQNAERPNPWERVHHEGYWLEIANRHTLAQQHLVMQMPGMGSEKPEQPLSATSANPAYFALEPHQGSSTNGSPEHDYAQKITATLEHATAQFAKRGQLRKVEMLELQKASQQIRTASWEAAVSTLQKLWLSPHWRRSGWWKLLQGIGWTLLDCLGHVEHQATLVKLMWELSNEVFDRKQGTDYDLRQLSVAGSTEGSHEAVTMSLDEDLSPFVATFVCLNHQVFVGEPMECQLTIRSRTRAELPAVRLSQISVVFDGNVRPIHLTSSGNDGAGTTAATNTSLVQLVDVRLHSPTDASSTSADGSVTLPEGSQTDTANLEIAPGQVKVYRVRVIPREAEEISVSSITLTIERGNFTLAATSTDFSHSPLYWWETREQVLVPRALGQESNAVNIINVLPKPPKLGIEAPNLRKSYYVNEVINIGFDFVNDESEEAVVTVEARMISPLPGGTQLRWLEDDAQSAPAASEGSGVLVLPTREVGTIVPADRVSASLRINETSAAVDHEIELTVSYHLASEPGTILKKSFAADVAVIRPFEANYSFTPRVDDESWPSFFDAPPATSDSSVPLGLKHLYTLTTSLFSFAADSIVVEAILLTATKITGGAVCSSSTGILRNGSSDRKEGETAGQEDASISTTMKAESTQIFDFDFAIQKLVLGDRQNVAIDLALEIGWRRHDSDEVNTTVLEAPRFVAAMSEPRVTLRASASTMRAAGIAVHQLFFTIENPSMHFLTFNVSLEASEDFAFSGSKACAVSLVPISKQTLTFRILPNKKDKWIGVNLNVVDAYFGQNLKVLPGGGGVKADKKGDVFVKV